jgi:hypothetical protein
MMITKAKVDQKVVLSGKEKDGRRYLVFIFTGREWKGSDKFGKKKPLSGNCARTHASPQVPRCGITPDVGSTHPLASTASHSTNTRRWVWSLVGSAAGRL